ncbi:MAG: VPEID-CTERM sorting domain-containing protein [Acidobacteriia bacterium]|nr:VPEID-CTERM sorting domain-containing protein [Terriglobia bacterium]
MNTKKILGMLLIGLGAAGCLAAQVASPEIDPATGANALALVAGALLIIRSRRRR